MNLTKIPPVMIVCLTVAFLGVLGAYVYLDLSGADGTQTREFMGTILQVATLLVASGGAAAAAQGAKQTNGDMEPRMKQAALEALREHSSKVASVRAGTDRRGG